MCLAQFEELKGLVWMAAHFGGGSSGCMVVLVTHAGKEEDTDGDWM